MRHIACKVLRHLICKVAQPQMPNNVAGFTPFNFESDINSLVSGAYITQNKGRYYALKGNGDDS